MSLSWCQPNQLRLHFFPKKKSIKKACIDGQLSKIQQFDRIAILSDKIEKICNVYRRKQAKVEIWQPIRHTSRCVKDARTAREEVKISNVLAALPFVVWTCDFRYNFNFASLNPILKENISLLIWIALSIFITYL